MQNKCLCYLCDGHRCACHYFVTDLPISKPFFSLDSYPGNYDRLNVLERGKEVQRPTLNKEFKKYISILNPEQERTFIYRFNQQRWGQIRKKLGLGDFKFHDLRKTFGSLLAQNGISTAVTQKLLEHSSSDLTNKVYTNVDPVLRHAVEQIPVSDWL